MTSRELKSSLREKCLEFEIALESVKPHEELLARYKELKEVQYQIVQSEIQEMSDSKNEEELAFK
jgi:hypothetical protein